MFYVFRRSYRLKPLAGAAGRSNIFAAKRSLAPSKRNVTFVVGRDSEEGLSSTCCFRTCLASGVDGVRRYLVAAQQLSPGERHTGRISMSATTASLVVIPASLAEMERMWNGCGLRRMFRPACRRRPRSIRVGHPRGDLAAAMPLGGTTSSEAFMAQRWTLVVY